MCSARVDLTARATIRDVALKLFAEHGPDAVSVRQIATTAGVSAALVLHHFGSKQGLRDAVDDHVVHLIDAISAELDDRDVVAAFSSGEPDCSATGTTGDGGEPALASMVDRALEAFPPGSPIPSYLTRLLASGDDAGLRLFRRWHTTALQHLHRWNSKGLAQPGPAPQLRAAVLLAHDLSSILLRHHITEVTGIDVFSADGMTAWSGEVTALYSGELWPPDLHSKQQPCPQSSSLAPGNPESDTEQ